MENPNPLELQSYDQDELIEILRQSVRENSVVESDSLAVRGKISLIDLLNSLQKHAISAIHQLRTVPILQFRPPTWMQWRWQSSHRKAAGD